MHMNLKPNKHKRISFNTTTMASLGFIATPKKFNFLLRSPPQLFWSEIFRSPRKLGGLLPWLPTFINDRNDAVPT